MSYTIQTDVMVPMRDGVGLATNIWLPAGDGPFPTLLVRTPYGAKMISIFAAPSPNVFRLMEEGYAVVIQECRGTGESEGDFAPHVAEAADGIATLDWLVEQPWCDGNIGTFGASYLGMVQLQMAAIGHTALKAIAPSVAPADFYRAPWYSEGGAFCTGALQWAAMMVMSKVAKQVKDGRADPSDMAAIGGVMADQSALVDHTPVGGVPLLAKHLPWLEETVFSHPSRDATWQALSAIEALPGAGLPALAVGGWYDLFIGQTLKTYTEVRTKAETAASRDAQYLVIGPWGHSPNGLQAMYPSRVFGMSATAEASDPTSAHIAYFDHYLKGKGDTLNRPRVRLFVMGLDQWRDEEDWPLPDTQFTDFYLGGAGAANTAGGLGCLSEQPAADVAVDRYVYDPRNPVPTHGGTGLALGVWDGAADQRPVHNRHDVLVFSTEVLDAPVEVTGPVSATLFVSSDCPDTDFTVKLVDLHPDGRAIILCDGIQRMRYRNGLAAPELMAPGEVYEITIDLIGTSNVFLPGHRILVEISSSNFPRYDRNSNTGGTIASEALADMKSARNILHRGGDHLSRIVLPLIKR